MQRHDKYIWVKSLYASWFLLLALFNACHKDSMVLLPDSEEVTITFSAKLPKVSSGGLKTYALGNTEETELKDVDVLVYIADGGNWRFHYRTVGKVIHSSLTQTGNGGGTADIEVRLWKTQIDSRLVILGNVRKQLNAYPFVNGELLSVLQENLVYELGAGERWPAKMDLSPDYTPLPMWAEYDIGGAINGSLVIRAGEISLLRSLARVDVSADGVASDFTLDKIHVYKSNRNGLVIPSTVTPSLPTPLLKNDSDVLEYNVIGNRSEAEIYLFEAKAGDDGEVPSDPSATALVIEGRFAGNPTSYFYRIDFKDATTGDLMPLLRNHCYKINIVGATYSGGGFSDRDAAFNASSLTVSYTNSSGLRPAHSAERSSHNLSLLRTGVLPRGQGDINYTVTEIDESK